MRVDVGHGSKDKLDGSFYDDLVAEGEALMVSQKAIDRAMILPQVSGNRKAVYHGPDLAACDVGDIYAATSGAAPAASCSGHGYQPRSDRESDGGMIVAITLPTEYKE